MSTPPPSLSLPTRRVFNLSSPGAFERPLSAPSHFPQLPPAAWNPLSPPSSASAQKRPASGRSDAVEEPEPPSKALRTHEEQETAGSSSLSRVPVSEPVQHAHPEPQKDVLTNTRRSRSIASATASTNPASPARRTRSTAAGFGPSRLADNTPSPTVDESPHEPRDRTQIDVETDDESGDGGAGAGASTSPVPSSSAPAPSPLFRVPSHTHTSSSRPVSSPSHPSRETSKRAGRAPTSAPSRIASSPSDPSAVHARTSSRTSSAPKRNGEHTPEHAEAIPAGGRAASSAPSRVASSSPQPFAVHARTPSRTSSAPSRNAQPIAGPAEGASAAGRAASSAPSRAATVSATESSASSAKARMSAEEGQASRVGPDEESIGDGGASTGADIQVEAEKEKAASGSSDASAADHNIHKSTPASPASMPTSKSAGKRPEPSSSRAPVFTPAKKARTSASSGGVPQNSPGLFKPFKSPVIKSVSSSKTPSSPSSSSSSTPKPPTTTPYRPSRLSSSFRPPTSSSSSSVTPSRAPSRRAQILALEQRLLTLKRARKIRADKSLERLRALARKWRTAAREAAKLLWESGGKEPAGMGGGGGEFKRSWGWAGQEGWYDMGSGAGAGEFGGFGELDSPPSVESVKAEFERVMSNPMRRAGKGKGREEDEQEEEKGWDMGRMLSACGVEPGMLKWDVEEEDWESEGPEEEEEG